MSDEKTSIQSCPICTEAFNKSKRKPIVCLQCQASICLECTKTYIISGDNKPHCMFCKNAWTYEFILDNIPNVWVKNQFAAWEESKYINYEKSLLPSTLDKAKETKLKREFNQKRQKFYNEELREIQYSERLITETLYNNQNGNLADQIILVRDLIKNYKNLVNKLSFYDDVNLDDYNSILSEKKGEKIAFIKPCPAENCKGFLSSKWMCGLCDTHVCPKCFLIKTDEEHVCKDEDLKTAELIKKDSKNCPGCGVSIFKIEGCFAPDTKILLFDGSIKTAKNITVGDSLLGDDNTSRTVLKCCSGLDDMFEITQSNGITYTVNSKHKLALKLENDEKVFITVDEYFNLPKECQEKYFGWRSTNETLSKIQVKCIGQGEYFGWEVDKNNLFVLEDFTVVRNCNQMFCTNCKTCWNWATRQVINGNIHNPHFFEWQNKRRNEEEKKSETDIYEAKECIWPLGENPNYNVIRTITWNMPDKVNNFLQFIRTVNHIYFWYRVDQNVDEIKLNESHRVDFILNTIEEQTFAKLVWNNYSSNRLTIAIRDVVDMLYQAAHDIINEIYSDIYKISKDPNMWQAKIRDNTSSNINKMNEFLDKKLDSIKQLTIYYNKCINKVYNRFKTGKKILLINPKNLNYLSTNRIVSEANLEEYFFSD